MKASKKTDSWDTFVDEIRARRASERRWMAFWLAVIIGGTLIVKFM